jgi:peroxiredoxin
MAHRSVFYLAFTIALFVLFCTSASGDQTVDIGQRLKDFELYDLQGNPKKRSDFPVDHGFLIVFFSIECPISRNYAPAFESIHNTYGAKGVRFVGVNANYHEQATDISAFGKQQGLTFPILTDPGNRLADILDAQSTPHAFLFDSEMRLCYKGEIDDGLGNRRASLSHGLYDALDALLDGRKITRPVTKSMGCIIRRAPKPAVAPTPKNSPTFARDILPFLQKNCQTCHHRGGVGPVAFEDYETVQAWAPDMQIFIRNNTMPPWPPNHNVVAFKDARVLQEEEKQLFDTWVANGMPKGDKADSPPPLFFPDTWTFGQPDIILRPDSSYTIEPNGPDEFRCFVLPLKLQQDAFVAGVEIQPGAKEATHHVEVWVDETGVAQKLDREDAKSGYASFGNVGFSATGTLGWWAPGRSTTLLPDGVGRFLPKTCDVVVRIHYHKVGKQAMDRLTLGIYLTRKPVNKIVYEESVRSRLLLIPPGVSNFQVSGSHTLDEDMHAIAVSPHMHLLGKSITLTAILPGGGHIPLVQVDRWSFLWQDVYTYPEPVALPRGTRIQLDAVYDNSADNPDNPNRPPKFVRWGDTTTDEMCIGYFFLTKDNENLLAKDNKTR